MSRRREKLLKERRQARRIDPDAHPDPDTIPDAPAGKASDYLSHLDELVAAGEVAALILYCRVSGGTQEYGGNNEDQAAEMRRRVADLGIPVVGVFDDVVSGWKIEDRPGFDAAIEAAKAHGPGTVVIAECTDRYLRHPDYNADKKSRPTVAAFEALCNRAHGIPLGTVLHPDATLKVIRHYQQDRGQVAKGTPVGRPRKPVKTAKEEFAALTPGKQRPALLSKTFWYRHVGFSVRETADIMDKEPKQIQRWIEKLEADAPVTTELEAPRPRRKYKKKSASENG